MTPQKGENQGGGDAKVASIQAGHTSVAGKVQGVLTHINNVTAVMGCVSFGLIMFITLYEVIARYILSSPTVWSLEISQFLMLIGIVLASSFTQEKGGHIKADFAVEYLSLRKKRMALIASSFLCLIFFVILAWKSVSVTWSTYSFGMRSMSMLAIPLFPIYVFIPIGCILLFVQGVLQFLQLFYKRQEK